MNITNYNYPLEMLSKIWKDPVWSKVISVCIIAIATFIYAYVKSELEGISLINSARQIIGIQVPLVGVIVLLIIYFVFKRLFKKRSGYTKEQIKLRKINNMRIGEGGSILAEWDVYFDVEKKPFISNLTLFCTKHNEVPIRFISGNCPVNTCSNHYEAGAVNLVILENYLESMIIENWKKIKSNG